MAVPNLPNSSDVPVCDGRLLDQLIEAVEKVERDNPPSPKLCHHVCRVCGVRFDVENCPPWMHEFLFADTDAGDCWLDWCSEECLAADDGGAA
jgi:hypothetical protein